jgi:hypothetical protein
VEPLDENGLWAEFADEQRIIATEIISALLQEGPGLIFLQGSAGTGKTFTAAKLIEILRARGKNCLICATTGIAAVPYAGRTTLYALFRLGIDEESRGGFNCNIGRGTPHALDLLGADLIMIDEVSMLTPWVANRVSLIVQWICESRLDFGGKEIFFMGDLLQLPLVIAGPYLPVVDRLITRLQCWYLIRKCRLEWPMRSPDAHWNQFLLALARGQRDGLPDWLGLRRFGATVVDDLEEALTFFCAGVNGIQPFPLDRQWIAAINTLADDINVRRQNWRSHMGLSL